MSTGLRMSYVDQLDAVSQFLGKLRTGLRDTLLTSDGYRFPSAVVPKRAISLFWYLPSFLLGSASASRSEAEI